MIYLDWAATSLPEIDIIEKTREKETGCFGNPSSIHKPGMEARSLVEESRGRIARVLSCKPGEIVFTSGGTESNNMVLFSMLSRTAQRGSASGLRIITTGIEHPSVFEPALSLGRFGFEVSLAMPDADGIVKPGSISEMLDPGTVLVSVMMVNNETGAIQQIKEIGEVIRGYSFSRGGRKIIFHVDAVQAFGKIPFFPRELGVDAATMSCHKLGGPKGTGCLYLSEEVRPEFLFRGGEQERSIRPGTENPGCAFGFALASERHASGIGGRLGDARKKAARLVSGIITINGAIIPGSRASDPYDERYSPYIVKAAFPRIPGEVLVRALDERGIAVSTGAACSSRKKKERHRVLLNMGIKPEIAESSIRISTGYATTDDDIDRCLDALTEEAERLRV